MYINFKYLEQKNLKPSDLVKLVCIRQLRSEPIAEYLIELCNNDTEELLKYEDEGFIEFVKGKAKDSLFQKARLTKKGLDLVDNAGVAGILDEDAVIWDWLAKKYGDEGKGVGNAKKGKRWLAQFRVESGLSRNRLTRVCEDFMHSNLAEYSKQLDYLFFKPSNVFETKFSLEGSKLWKYYCANKEHYEEVFKGHRFQEL